MIWFFLPFVYLLHTRLKTKFELISWQIIFFVPQLIITYYYLDIRSNIFIHLFLISQLIFYSIYETGYIQNDIVTTKKEKKPTIRLNKKNFIFVAKNYFKLIYFRYFIALFFLSVMYWLDTFTSYNLKLLNFVLVLTLTKIIFYIHNSIRNRFTIITYFLLSILKYSFPIILFINFDKLIYPLIITIMIFPVLRVIEVTTLNRYKYKSFKKLIGNIDKFRILYYFVFFVGIVTTKLFFGGNIDFYLSISIILYFLFFRIACFYLVKHQIYKRDEAKKN
tara:strand:+ start:2359 stop:3192 length:834 start_codon:yes stop_codon:yes gene_type:complete